MFSQNDKSKSKIFSNLLFWNSFREKILRIILSFNRKCFLAVCDSNPPDNKMLSALKNTVPTIPTYLPTYLLHCQFIKQNPLVSTRFLFLHDLLSFLNSFDFIYKATSPHIYFKKIETFFSRFYLDVYFCRIFTAVGLYYQYIHKCQFLIMYKEYYWNIITIM